MSNHVWFDSNMFNFTSDDVLPHLDIVLYFNLIYFKFLKTALLGHYSCHLLVIHHIKTSLSVIGPTMYSLFILSNYAILLIISRMLLIIYVWLCLECDINMPIAYIFFHTWYRFVYVWCCAGFIGTTSPKIRHSRPANFYKRPCLPMFGLLM